MTTKERLEEVEQVLATARRIDLVDGQGQTRIMVCTSKDGPHLVLFANDGMDPALLFVPEDGPVKIRPDDKLKLWAALNVATDKMHLELYDEAQKALSSLGMGDLREIRELRNVEGKIQVAFRASPVNVEFWLHDVNGRQRASLAIGKGAGDLRLFDENGKAIWPAP